ncbi:hypothetical protein SLEP1_g40841 [Rubroshorea leprosula]|uniref:Uncharacterized protein n=1 Tax=Rubroshorea leprosula TaxID=152421 RepID=A0AAV5L4T6_9ROSI|nr:hypothetical protein SLEP1_g40841 [Rubroshorea leprosula]
MPHPIMLFKKPLKPTDITKRLAIPTKCLDFLPHFNGGHAVKLNVFVPGKGLADVALYKEVDETGLQYRMEVYRATRVPPPNGNSGVATPYKTKMKTGFKQFGEELFNSSKKICLRLASDPEEIVLNLDLTLAPPGNIPS